MRALKYIFVLAVPGALVAWVLWKWIRFRNYNDARIATGAGEISFWEYLSGK